MKEIIDKAMKSLCFQYRPCEKNDIRRSIEIALIELKEKLI